MRQCFEAVTPNAAKVMHLGRYGLDVGCDASFVVLQARDTIEAIRLRATRLYVFRRGVRVATSVPTTSTLSIGGRSDRIDWMN